MNLRWFRRRAAARVVVLAGIVAAVALAVAPVAFESSSSNGLRAFVVASTEGPLSTCTGTCNSPNTVWEFIYVSNGNEIVSTLDGQFDSRDTLHNAFLVSSVEQRIFVDGEDTGSATYYPPPNEYPRSWADHWPSTLKCPAGTDPCTLIGSPAVVPGEQAAVLFAGWGHASGEPNGKYVFRYTVHGTLNGEPVDVTASSKPIFMTD
jgi:hypothetical protein